MALWATKVKLNMITPRFYMTVADGKTLDAAAKLLFKLGVADFWATYLRLIGPAHFLSADCQGLA